MTMTTASETPGRARDGDPQGHLHLREEDLEVGRPFVHPETRLEYEDFHTYLAGKDPLPHWRNARIKSVLEECRGDPSRAVSRNYGLGVYHTGRQCIDALFNDFDRHGLSKFGIDYGAYAPL